MKRLIPLMAAAFLTAQASAALPKATTLVAEMGFGINIGNTMEVPISSSCANMSCWGNQLPTKVYIDSIAAAGFKSVRIPTAWYTHSTDGVVATTWLDSVKTVVDYCISDGLYVVLNSHWDSGWMEDNVFSGTHSITNDSTATTDSSKVRALQAKIWGQIATKFKDYDEHLLFASGNEPGVNDPWLTAGQVAFDAGRMGILNAYHQAMIDTVRATGGNNATRTIIVQGPRTDEALTHSLMASNMPSDPAGAGYMMLEFHFYPYQFSLDTKDETWGNCFYYWGDGNYSTTDAEHNANYVKATGLTDDHQYAGPAYVDSVFAMLKSDFVDQGYPVIIGEYAAIKRLSTISDTANLRLHLQSRVAFYHKVDSLSKAYGFVPFAWDTGAEGIDDNTIIRRQSGAVGAIMDYDVLNAMRTAYGMDALPYSNIDSLVSWAGDNTNRSAEVTYTSARSDSSETGTLRVDVGGKDWSDYVAISFLAKVDVSNSALDGASYGWTTLSLFAMSGNWSWTDYNFDQDSISTSWKNYLVPFNSDGLTFTDQTNVMAIGLNLYGTVLSGTIMIDNVVLWKADGTSDTLSTFNKALPGLEGIATGKLVETPSAAASAEAISADVIAEIAAGIKCVRKSSLSSGLTVNIQPGSVSALFRASNAGFADVSLLNSLGQTIVNSTVRTAAGSNSVQLNTNYRGTAFLVVRQGGSRYTASLRLK